MADNEDLTSANLNDPVIVGDATMASLGSQAPTLADNITALLFMAGAQARWNWDFWLVLSNKTSKRAHVHATATFEDWRIAVNELAGGGFGAH